MGKRLLIVLGNGFSVDFLHHFRHNEKIDVSNLFRYGAHVPWPANSEPGFLSVKWCPNLWHLGARPTMNADEAISLIEDIITCVNVYSTAKPEHQRAISSGPNKIYIHAYQELVRYLRHLFVYYDKKIADPTEAELIEWPWARFFRALQDNPDVDEVHIITFNYDVWLERTFRILGIEFTVCGFGEQDKKFKLYKPHGSISFCHKRKLDRQAFNISYQSELVTGKLEDFEVRYADLDDYFPAEPIIPPAGDAYRIERQPDTWAGEIRTAARTCAQTMTATDRLIVSGLSYWHVDRAELDEILVGTVRDLDVVMINPKPNRAMNAVLTSLFEKYIFMSSTDTLTELAK